MDTATRILILAVMIGLASAQINFSTSWGKRSASAAAAASSFPVNTMTRQQFHSRKEPTPQQQTLMNAEPQDQDVVLPTQCLSLLKSLLWVNQIVESEMQRMDKYGRQVQSTAPVSDP